MRNAISDAVTPGMKRRMSVMVPPMLKSGFPAAAILALLWAWIRVKMIIATSKTLDINVSMFICRMGGYLRHDDETKSKSSHQGLVINRPSGT
jgi:hypothetical protein